MSFINQINLNYLRIFMAVFRTGSMTSAAKELHLTQSGISQQIKALEEGLDVILFNRTNRKVIPTQAAITLSEYCEKQFEELNKVFQRISSKEDTLYGTVKIGFPPVFGNETVIPTLAKFHHDHPGIHFEMRLGTTSDLISLLQQGKLDFAFIDSFVKDSNLTTDRVFTEKLYLCCHNDLLAQYPEESTQLRYFRKLPFVGFIEGEPVLRSWFQQNFRTSPHDLNIVATAIDISTVAHLIAEGIVCGLLPLQLVEKMRKDQQPIHVFKSRVHVTNTISAAYLASRTLSSVSRLCYTKVCQNIKQ